MQSRMDHLFPLLCQVLSLLRVMGMAAAVQREVVCSTGACYTVHLDSTHGFDKAEKECGNDGGHLVTVKSQEEALHLETLLLKLSSRNMTMGMLKFWIGLRLKKKECYQQYKALKGFSWISEEGEHGEEETQFSNWMEEPRRTCTANRCVTMNFHISSPSKFKWSDGSCQGPVDGYICKFSFQGMCRRVALAGPGVVEYTMPFRFMSTSLNLVPFGTMASVSCGPQGEQTGPFMICKENTDSGFDWSRQGPFCASPSHGCNYNNGGCEQECLVENGNDSIRCGCRKGYELRADQVTCDMKNHCKSNPCQQDCINLLEGFSCSCSTGYLLAENQVNCTDEDECLKGPCDQECINSPGSFSCRCLPGFEAVGNSCQDRDECWPDSPCAQGCMNTNGSYVCYCKEGYVKGDTASTCVDVDECQKKPCEDLCHNTLGSYECSCGQGLTLAPDGISCMPEQFQIEMDSNLNNETGSIDSPNRESNNTHIHSPGSLNPESKPDTSHKKVSEEAIQARGVTSTYMPAITPNSYGTVSVDHIKREHPDGNTILLFSVVACVVVILLLLAFALGLLMFRRRKNKKENETAPQSAADKYSWADSGNKAVENEYR